MNADQKNLPAPVTAPTVSKTNRMKCVLCGEYQKKYPMRSFHRFPKDPEMSNKWASVTEKKWILGADVLKRHCAFKICSDHFTPDQYANPATKRLSKNALPAPYTALSSDYTSIKKMKECIKEKLDEGEVTKASEVSSEMEFLTQFQVSTPKSTKNKPNVTPKTRKIRTLSTKLYYLHRKFRKINENKSLGYVLQLIKGLVSPVIFNFIECQLRSSCVSKYGRRWSVKDKNLALQLYLTSPRAYNSLSQHFNLPSRKTLLKCLSGIKTTPGFSESVLNAIKLVASKMKPLDKYCIVSFDEMKLQKGVSYNVKNDQIEGYENYGSYSVTNPRFATHALVFMVRGLCRKWKQVFGYFYSHESAPSSALKHLVNEGLSKLIECGLEPIAIVCDQGSNNQRLYETELGISADKPFFFVQSHKVYSICDAPHLLKCIRNNFKRYPVKFVNDNENKIAYWEHIVRVWEVDSKLPHRMAPKLTRRHVEVNGLSSMNVRLAAQVFSNTVSGILSFMSSSQILPPTASDTADFCALMNELFESVNSRLLHHPDRPLLSAVSRSSSHMMKWNLFTEFIQSIKFQTPGKKIKFPCLQGWLITLSAFRKMIPELLIKIPYIMISRFTQDALENFFSLVRRKGGNNDHPTPTDFKYRVKMLMAQHIISTCGTANCEPDNDTVLVPVEVLTESACSENGESSLNLGGTVFGEDSFSELHADIFHDNPAENFNELDTLLAENSAAYVAGYVAKITLKKFNCSACKSALLGEKILDQCNLFIFFKEYEIVNKGLNVPSKGWLDTTCEFGRRFPVLYDMYVNATGVKCYIVNNLSLVNHDWLSCDNHGIEVWEFLVNFYTKLMLFYKVKYVSNTFRNPKRSCKKLKKLS